MALVTQTDARYDWVVNGEKELCDIVVLISRYYFQGGSVRLIRFDVYAQRLSLTVPGVP